MNDVLSTPAGQADGQPDPRGMTELMAEAEAHVASALHVPAALLPSQMEGHPLLPFAVALRRGALRRLRIRDRLRVATETLVGQALAVVEVARPELPRPVEANRVVELHARLQELDRQLRDEANVFVDAARGYAAAHRPGLPSDALPDAYERARQRGLGPQD